MRSLAIGLLAAALPALQEMEATGGEPDVIGRADDPGGFFFCDRRFGRTLASRNGAESYRAARGFRGALRV